MLKIENYEVLGWEHAIRGMRNPKNSWAKSDSTFKEVAEIDILDENGRPRKQRIFFDALNIGPNDMDLMMRLRNGGSDDRKFMRMIVVYLDIEAPLYWWKEFDTYKVGTVANSCSTMHKIHSRDLTEEDFSTEHLTSNSRTQLNCIIRLLNDNRKIHENWKETNADFKNKVELYSKKDPWWQMIQMLPTSYNQKRTVMLNYEVLTNMYHARKTHKLDEWHTFCDWIKELPYSELIIKEKS